jgi:hypothetical protein
MGISPTCLDLSFKEPAIYQGWRLAYRGRCKCCKVRGRNGEIVYTLTDRIGLWISLVRYI